MHNLSSDMVSRIEYDEKEQECIAKEEQIQVILFIFFVDLFDLVCGFRFYKLKFVVWNIYFT
jgi:hypothetical protein